MSDVARYFHTRARHYHWSHVFVQKGRGGEGRGGGGERGRLPCARHLRPLWPDPAKQPYNEQNTKKYLVRINTQQQQQK